MKLLRIHGIAFVATMAALPALAFDLQGHRGARGLAPENTLAAFSRALAIGVTTLETDLAVTKDGVLVISHNPRPVPDLTRDADSKWLREPGPPIHTLDLAELRRYDIGRANPESKYAKLWPEQKAADGERFPTLAEVFVLVRASGKPVRLNIETKITPTAPGETPDAETFARLVVDAVRGATMTERVTVQSFDWRTLIAVKRLAPEIATSCLTIESDGMNTVRSADGGASPWHAGLALKDYGGSLPRLVKAAGCGTWSMFWRNLRPESAAEARALGLKLLPWAVNDPVDMARLIDLGVDGLITDYPDRLRKVMTEKGLPLP